MSLIHPEEAHAIVACPMDVHREVGPGYDEPAYQLAATSAFRKASIPCQMLDHPRASLPSASASGWYLTPSI